MFMIINYRKKTKQTESTFIHAVITNYKITNESFRIMIMSIPDELSIDAKQLY